MKTKKIAFIGGGNMASSLIAGLLTQQYPREKLLVTARSAQRLATLKHNHHIETTQHNCEACLNTEIIVLATKPAQITDVCKEIRSSLEQGALVISVAAGVRLETLQQVLGKSQAIIRTMPNTPASIGYGATALLANEKTQDDGKKAAEQLFSAVGSTHWLTNESQMDTVTALSGSGPAYFFRLVEALEKAGVDHELPPQLARQLSIQTALGAAHLMLESKLAPKELRHQVTSPNGTTAAGLAILEAVNIEKIIHQVISSAKERAQQIAITFNTNPTGEDI